MSSVTLPVPMRLNGRSLLAGRLLYILLLLVCAGMFGVSLFHKFVQGTAGCDSIYNFEWAGCASWFQTIEDLSLTPVIFESYFLILRIVAALPFFILSLLLVRRRGAELRVLLFAGLLLVMGIAGTPYNAFWEWAGGWFKNYSPYPSLALLSSLLTFFFMGGSFLFVMLFPDGRFYPRWSRWVAGAWIILVAGYIFFPETNLSLDQWPFPLNSFISLAFALFGTAIIIMRYRRQATTVQRQQIKWIAFSLLLLALNLLLDYSVFTVYPALTGSYLVETGRQAVLWELGQDTISYVTLFILGIGFGLAVFRHHLWDIDIILNRTLVYGSLTLLVIALYIAIVEGLGLLFQAQTNVLAGLVATGIIAVLFQPLRDRLQRGVNHLLYGERDDPAAVLMQLAHHLETADAPAAILPNLVGTIAITLKIPYAAVCLPGDGELMEPAAEWGRSPDVVEKIPLTYQNKMIGQLVVAPRGPNEQFNQHEWQLLNTIAALTATTVRAVRLSDELRRSRRRIVAAREEERRRIRRDLHDGLGPQLASQTLGLEAAEQLMPADPEKAYTLLASLKIQAQEAILDVRRLVYDLRPPALDDLGLAGALQQSASHYENGTVRFTFDMPLQLSDLPAAVETAAYRIAQEAMTNVMRHTRATACTVRLVCTETHLVVEVVDNGQGLLPEVRAGVGLLSMRERAAELNGQCVIESRTEGGTRVQARLPLEVDDE